MTTSSTKHLNALRITAVFLACSICSSVKAECVPGSHFIHFNFHRITNYETESRYVRTDAQINTTGYFQYSHDDEVIGSVNAVAVDRNDHFSEHKPQKCDSPQVKDIRKLVSDLRDTGFFSQKSGPEPEKLEYPFKYHMSLYVSCGDYYHGVAFFSERDAAAVALAIQLVQRYVERRLSSVQLKTSRLESESDAATPIHTSIANLLKNPTRYHGKRVKVSGHFAHGLENVSLTDLNTPNASLWVGGASSFGSVTTLEPYNDARVSMEGIFVSGMRGHFGM